MFPLVVKELNLNSLLFRSEVVQELTARITCVIEKHFNYFNFNLKKKKSTRLLNKECQMNALRGCYRQKKRDRKCSETQAVLHLGKNRQCRSTYFHYN